ncbi:nucleoside diphosphate kinase regulator [Mesorhizobium sp.]|uniref:nucleoside diphosphate kinase regulator n=1 Tax=Mesorhizobium sp. TaxID=1871066 RepID=UPI00121EEC97|nr:nucleoside diphosphate kinase regulator [Mesorhizobium sp.]TIO04511.1 MAG: nucleoside diphosphate kinase regulator [Mesorhizobium sp.]TIO28857.1 MAG: nucleoside diphosphate kinase regulator [Mesorhizobium sp.]TIP12907.1 MAG: nucleoside diphosphate kinase regulator [Mesorhizobium sp.]
MQHETKLRPQGLLLVSDADHDRLTGLARAFIDRAPVTAEELLMEMDRATITAAAAMPADVVRMGSAVTIRSDGGSMQHITLVYPGDADIAENKISVLTPLGTALIGAAVGQAISWKSRDGRELSVTIDAVEASPSGQRP